MVERVSLVTLTSSRKYSTDTLESWFVAEKVTSRRTDWFDRMVIALSLACTTENAVTMGRGTASWTELVRPGVGPVASGEASQLAGSLAEELKLTRSSERPRYWKFAEFNPVHSSSAPSASAPMAHGNAGE
jgi:hypothetical protein